MMGTRSVARALALGLATAISATLLVACGSGDSAAPPSSSEPAPAPQPPAPRPAPTPTPEPPVATGPDAAEGEAIYQVYCASCHGPRGEGDGPAAAALDPKPARHSDGAYMNALGNDHLFKVIADGGAAVGKSPLMAPWGGSLDDEQIWHLVAFLRSLADPPYEGPQP
jgi:mono/diheme cytochrome c family protein